MRLAIIIFVLLVLIGATFILVYTIRKARQKPPVVMCGCGAMPVHTPDVPTCRAVNEAQGREVTAMGFVISRDGKLFYDGVDWLVNPDYKVGRRGPKLDRENTHD